MYINHSGGCEGADMAWETVGLEYKIKTISYSFYGHTQYGGNPYIMSSNELNEGWKACEIASETLQRPLERARSTYVRKLICRNWFQVKHSDSIYAIGMLEKGKDHLVNGGTGWAVQMAIDNKKSVYLFEQDMNTWLIFDYSQAKFIRYNGTPILTNDFAGIGTRNINDKGLQAIVDVYKETFK
jgi:hypothetical protein